MSNPHVPKRSSHGRRKGKALSAVTAAALASFAVGAVSAPAAHAASASLVRVDQAGFLPSDTKQAYLMAGAAVSGATFNVVDSTGASVFSGSVGGTSLGSWNTNYPDVYPISFSGLTAPGTYHITVSGGTTASSPTFTVESASALYGKLVADSVNFFQVQRDGSTVIAGPLNRQPSHLHDASANVYAWPSFASGGSDTITNSDLSKTGGPVDASGGWFDAGDFLKFTHTTAYADALLFASERALGSAAPSGLDAEAHFGEGWLNKMWDQTNKILYLQVGIGSGNSAGTFTGDHDLWRLPQNDDGDTATADRYSAAHRPVFEAAAAGAKISPNLAGRVSAAFALAAQVDASANPTQASAEYQAATSLYAMANTTTPPSPLTTALPNAYYPESSWHDDMEFGGAEIALAAQALGQNASGYLSQAASYASSYIASDSGNDTFNLYDTSALAHADLIKAMAAAGNPSLAVTPAALIADLKKQVQAGATKAASDIFHAGGDYANFDVDSHTFGLMATEALYKQASGDASFDSFATEQRDWLLGSNAWGTSFMVGEGTTFPHCMQHQVANLSGSLDGTGAIAAGAVVNGPNNTSNFTGGLGSYQTGMRACPAGGSDPFAAYDGHSSQYVDDVRSWQSSEPAIDMTGTAMAGVALQQAVAAPSPTNDFSISDSPSSGSVTAGSPATTTVSTAVTSGSATSVSLSASGLPTGATATFNPVSVTAGGSSTLTIATSSTTPAGTYTVTVTGTSGSTVHSTTYSLAVGSAGGSTEAITNGGFETGDFTGWTRGGAYSAITTSPVHSGTHAAMLGNTSPTNGDSTIAQTFTAPSGASTVSFWYNQNCPDAVTYDWARATLKDNTAATTVTMLANTCTINAGWKQVSSPVTPGHSYTITLLSHDENNPGDATDTVYDDVSCAGSGTVANDFSLSSSPTSGSVTAGTSASTTVSTAVTSGSAQSVSLAVSGLPSGATATFNPASVTAGGSSTLTIATSSTTPAGTSTITVTGTAASGSHSATYTLTVTAPSTCTPAQLVADPGFESGTNPAAWTQTSTLGFQPITQATTAEPAHSGSWIAWFDGNGTKDTDTIAQNVTIPSGCNAALTYWLHIDSTENTTTAAPDTFKLQVLNTAGTVLATVGSVSNLNKASGYTQYSADLSAYAGQTVTLKFTGAETDSNGGTTDFVLDDTALNVS